MTNAGARKIHCQTIKLLVVFGLLVGWLTHVNAALPETIKKIKSSVVVVGTFNPTRHPRAVFLGTGFAIVGGNLIATNAHVLPQQLNSERKEELAVFVKEAGKDKMIAVDTVASDKDNDLAILKMREGSLTPFKLGDSEVVSEGETYAFTGFPIGMVLGLFPVTHRGIISAITPIIIPVIQANQIDNKVLKRLRNPIEVFQMDATAYPGNSGSPLYDPDTGDVVGIINKVFIQESKEMAISKPSGITYAIPINFLKTLMKQSGIN